MWLRPGGSVTGRPLKELLVASRLVRLSQPPSAGRVPESRALCRSLPSQFVVIATRRQQQYININYLCYFMYVLAKLG